MASTKTAALAKARQRRAELDRDRAARDSRIEAAVADVFVQQQARVDAEQAAARADLATGAALRLLLGVGVSFGAVAQLCDLSVTEVRRLTRTQARAHKAKETEGDQPAGAGFDGGQSDQRAKDTELRPRSERRAGQRLSPSGAQKDMPRAGLCEPRKCGPGAADSYVVGQARGERPPDARLRSGADRSQRPGRRGSSRRSATVRPAH